MEYKAICELIKVMSNSELSFLEVGLEGVQVIMKKEYVKILETSNWDNTHSNNRSEILKNDIIISNNDKKVHKNTTHESSVDLVEDIQSENYKFIKSPIVGTLHNSGSMDSHSYVKIGSRVKKGDILCIVEAMKLMNEIESEFDCEIIEIFGQDGQLVEYNQPLFKVKI